MNTLFLKGLTASLAVGAALTIAAPSIAAPHHNRVVIGAHGGVHGARMVRFHRFAPGHFNRLSIVQRDHWRRGHWWHGAHHGRTGWWWFTGGLWYWYPEPVYPYPTYISTTASYDYAPQGYSESSWYYCDDPQGYYPYVRACNSQWRPVPISPQARADATYGEPPMSGNAGSYSDDGAYDNDDMDDSDQDMDNDEDDSDDSY